MLKLLLKNSLLRFLTGLVKGKKNKAVSLGGPIAIVVALVVLILASFGAMALGFAEAAKAFADGTRFFALSGALFSFLLVFVGSVFFTMSAIFEAKDNDLLLSMPIEPRTVALARLISVLLLDFSYALIIYLPFFVVGIFTKTLSGTGAVLYGIGGLFLPLFAMAVTSLLAWGIALLSAKSKNPKAVHNVFFTLLFAITFVFYIGMQNVTNLVLKNPAKLMGILTHVYPVSFLGDAAEGNAVSFLLFVLIAAAAFVAVWLLLGRSFLRIATTKTSGAKKVYRAKETAVRTPVNAIVRKETRRFFGTPMYLFNAGMGLIFIVVLGILVLIKGNNIAIALLDGGVDRTFATLLFAAGLLFANAMTLISAPSVALESNCLWILKSAPLSAKDVLLGKAAAHFVIATVPNAFAAVCVGIAMRDLFGGIVAFLAAELFAAFTACLGLNLACAMPRFDYVSETAAVKQSAPVGFGMLLGLLAAIAVGGGGALVGIFFGSLFGLLALLLLSALAAVLTGSLLLTVSVRKFEKIEH